MSKGAGAPLGSSQVPDHTNWEELLGFNPPCFPLTCVLLDDPKVLERLKGPLESLISRDDPATTYAVLAHVLLLAKRAPIIFVDDHAAFYCRAHDPW